MNGSELQAAIERERRAHEKALEVADAALRMEQASARMEREVTDLRREMNDGFSEVAAELRALKGTRRQLQSFTETEWEDSPSKIHKLKKVKRAEWEEWQRERELTVDAKRWRRVLSTSGKVALAIVLMVLGFVVRHALSAWFGK